MDAKPPTDINSPQLINLAQIGRQIDIACCCMYLISYWKFSIEAIRM